jgi:polysaccharide pyruvyl transferase WcaK-like protein
VTARAPAAAGRRSAAPRVGLFGWLGSGNIGNDASMESLLRFLSADHPDAIVDAMCMGPETVRRRYGIDAVPLMWYLQRERRAAGMTAVLLKVLGKGIDTYRTAAWVRRHDLVIVPGMGVLEATLPLRPTGLPYTMFLLCGSGKLFRTKVALVSVGANAVNQRVTRWLFRSAAALAFYRSYRDTLSWEAMRRQGAGSPHDRVYPDVAFSLPMPPYEPGDPLTVGVGVMQYHGGNDDRRRASEINAAYTEGIGGFIRYLVDNGRRVRLFVGDVSDEHVAQEILAGLREQRPGLDAGLVVAEHMSSFSELAQAMAPASAIVATRYHNLVCALMLAKPTISVGYAEKNSALMGDMGLAGFCQSARSLNLDRLIGQFRDLEDRSAQLRPTLMERNAAYGRLLDEQFAVLSAVLFPGGRGSAYHHDVAKGGPANGKGVPSAGGADGVAAGRLKLPRQPEEAAANLGPGAKPTRSAQRRALIPARVMPLARTPVYALRATRARLLTRMRPEPARPAPAPIFIVGCGRSGTTLIGDLFATHPAVSYLHEPYDLWAAIEPATDFVQLYSHGEHYCLLDADSATVTARNRFRRMMSPPPGFTLVEKNPINALRIGYLQAMAPGARFVHIVRDGVDVANSIAKMAAGTRRLAFRPLLNDWWGVGDAKWTALQRDGRAAGYYPDEVRQLATDAQRGAYEWLLSLREVEGWRACLGPRLAELRYQDLVDDPMETLRAVAGSIGLSCPDWWLAQAPVKVRHTGSHTDTCLALPDQMRADFNDLQARFGFKGRAAGLVGQRR